MTPKEKAKDLVSKINNLLFTKKSWNSFPYEVKSDLKRKCFIVVDEILESHYVFLTGVNPSIYKYWQEVKQEIEKL